MYKTRNKKEHKIRLIAAIAATFILIVASFAFAGCANSTASSSNSTNTSSASSDALESSPIVAIYYRDGETGLSLKPTDSGSYKLIYEKTGSAYPREIEVPASSMVLIQKLYDSYDIGSWGDISPVVPNPDAAVTFEFKDGTTAMYDTSMTLPNDAPKMFSDVKSTLMTFVDGEATTN